MFRIIASSVVAPSLEKAGKKPGLLGCFLREGKRRNEYSRGGSRGERRECLQGEGRFFLDRVKIKGSIVVGDRSVTLKISE